MKQLTDALGKALRYLASKQGLDGSFESFSSSKILPFHPRYTYRTTFTASSMLAALSRCNEPAAMSIRVALSQFLLAQKSTYWSFNYWPRDSIEAENMPYPDDLDDTFCSLSALWLHDPTLIDEIALANMTKLLIATESQTGGPYYTWLVPATAAPLWRDVDVAVNTNVAYFLSLAVAPLPNLTKLMEETIKNKTFNSTYYPTIYPVLYYLARAYKGPRQKQLAYYIAGKRLSIGHWGTPLQTALAMTALLHVDYSDLRQAAEFLLHNQSIDGSWDAEVFCLDPKRNGQSFYNGSAALTTAFAIEALQAYQAQAMSKKLQIAPNQKADSPLRKQIVTQAAKELRMLGHDLRFTALEVLQHTIRGKNADEIMLLPHIFYRSLRHCPPLPQQLFVDLGRANLYGWIAYSIYDDFLDNEAKPRYLPAANIAMRRSLRAFCQALPDNQKFIELVQTTFDTIDEANAWEVANCRFAVGEETIEIGEFPDFGELDHLAERSLGHTLTPLGVLAAANIPLQGSEAVMIQTALRHYIIARQLNDDAHDWKADLQAGRITYVLTCLLGELHIRPGIRPLKTLTTQLEQQFWHNTLAQVCHMISHHTHKSRQALQTSTLLKSENTLKTLLDHVDKSVQDTRSTMTQVENFLRAYKQDVP